MFSLFHRESTESVHASELDGLLPDINLIDIREPYEYAQASIKNSRNIPMSQLLSAPEKYLSKENKYYIICQSGGRSSSATAVLGRAGYDVVNVRGGMSSYFGKYRK